MTAQDGTNPHGLEVPTTRLVLTLDAETALAVRQLRARSGHATEAAAALELLRAALAVMG